MVRGMYTAASGAVVAQSNVDVIANNLANVDTSGFKRTLMQIEATPKALLFRDQIDPGKTAGNRTAGVAAHVAIGELGFGSRIYDTPAVFDQGALATTGNPLDVALSGPGFLAVRDSAGNVHYTRGGSLVVNAQGTLVTDAGASVMSADGKPVGVPASSSVVIDRSGTVNVNGKPTTKLGVFEFADLSAVRPLGGNTFINGGPAPKPATATTVVQGAQEKSNVSVVRSMVDLITNQRWFEANQKMIQTQDTELGAAITTIGKTAP